MDLATLVMKTVDLKMRSDASGLECAVLTECRHATKDQDAFFVSGSYSLHHRFFTSPVIFLFSLSLSLSVSDLILCQGATPPPSGIPSLLRVMFAGSSVGTV